MTDKVAHICQSARGVDIHNDLVLLDLIRKDAARNTVVKNEEIRKLIAPRGSNLNLAVAAQREGKSGKMENMKVLREWFDRVDSEKSGSITADQLQRAFAVGNLDFAITVVEQMIRMYDFDRNGTMSFGEFVTLNKFLLKVQQSFSSLERGKGYLVHDEVFEALMKSGFSLDSPSFFTVCESFDPNKNGKFHLDNFISLCIFLQSARNLFNSFDTAKQGRVTLDFNQFVYCAANCRI